jgi:hypothetical protein
MWVLTCFDAAALWPSAVGVFGVSASIFLFFHGFRMLQYKRLILNTPLSKIRSASMGLVEVSGVPVGPHTLTSPVTGEPCFYYSVRAWQWSASGGRGSWQRVLDESVCLSFFVEDSTGKVLGIPKAHIWTCIATSSMRYTPRHSKGQASSRISCASSCFCGDSCPMTKFR